MGTTRERIAETAFLLFLKRGYKAVTLMDVVNAVGMTKGTFYYHFTNKKELLKEGVEAYYCALNRRREEEFARMRSLREFVDVTVGHLTEMDNYTAKHFGSDIPEILYPLDGRGGGFEDRQPFEGGNQGEASFEMDVCCRPD